MLEPIDVGRLIDGRGISRFAVGVVVFAFFILLVDGYDISVSAFAGPADLACPRCEENAPPVVAHLHEP